MKIVGMARLYQEQHKFDQAVTIYRKAILIARKALMNEDVSTSCNLLASLLGESVFAKDACSAGSGLSRTPDQRQLERLIGPHNMPMLWCAFS